MYRLIHIEPDEAAHVAVLAALAQSPLPFAVDRVDDPIAAADIAAETTVDAVLLSAGGEGEALDLLAGCRGAFATQPLIVIAASADLGFAQEALRAGAQDVIVRQEKALAVLPRILLYAIERAGAEARRRDLEIEAANLAAVVDAVFADSRDGLVQLDATGTIQRLSPTAASLLGLASPARRGCRLVSLVRRQDEVPLQALLEAGRLEKSGEAGHHPAASTFKFEIEGVIRMLEVRPLKVRATSTAAPLVLELSELAAGFTVDEPMSAEGASTTPPVTAAPPVMTARQRPGAAVSLMERPAVQAPAAAPAAPAAAAVRPMALIEALDRAATWRIARSAGSGADWGLLVADPKSTAVLARLAAVCRDDPDVALALDELRLRAWQKLATAVPGQLPALLALEVSYTTAASRPHLERFLAAVAEPSGQLFKRAPLVLGQVPKGIHVPTLAKTLRTLVASRQAKPALQLPTLDADLRALPLGELAVLILDVEELKQALARDGKAVTAFLAQAAQQGCPTLVKGAGGPLAQALRNRLGINLTVET